MFSIQSDRGWAIVKLRTGKNFSLWMCKACGDVAQKTCSCSCYKNVVLKLREVKYK